MIAIIDSFTHKKTGTKYILIRNKKIILEELSLYSYGNGISLLRREKICNKIIKCIQGNDLAI
jgi:hypothetical protein